MPSSQNNALWRRTRRILLIFVLVIACLAGLGLLYQGVSSAQDASGYPAPGKLIGVGGYRLHLYCTGTGSPGSPTVILEAGFGDTSLAWSKVQPGVASFARVCSYDHAGYGWSDAGPSPRTAGRLVAELHTLLTSAGVPGPYVLVGHSYGGLLVRLFAYTYPSETAGLVLVDSVSEDQARYPELPIVNAGPLGICEALAPFGIGRLAGFYNGAVTDYPAATQPAAVAQFNQTRHCRAASDEYAAVGESAAQIRAARRPLGDLPLVVLTHGMPELGAQGERDWQTLQAGLAGLSSAGAEVTATHSGHYILLEQPDLVVAAIKQVLAANDQSQYP